MPKLYLGLGLILLLGFSHWKTYTISHNSGVTEERTKWQELELKKNQELFDLQAELDAAEARAKANSLKREEKLNESKKQVYRAADSWYDVTTPLGVLRALCETGRADKSLCEPQAIRPN